MGLANSVEGRFPFLDHRVVEFAAAIPPHLKLKCLREKHVLREAAHGLLPDPVLERTKQPYRAPDQDSFFPGGEPHNYVLEALSPTRISEAGLFAPEAVTSLLAKARKQSSLGTKDGMALVGLLSTQILFRQFVANEGVASDPGMPAARRS
jgi:asparagine synthase (glutamine-hydrolysing)